MATRASNLLYNSLSSEMTIDGVWLWSDSTAVLKFIASDSRRFKVYVSNRVAEIRESTKVWQWNYIPTLENPADIASRGISAIKFVSCKMWLFGPRFLCQNVKERKFPVNECSETDKLIYDSEVKNEICATQC